MTTQFANRISLIAPNGFGGRPNPFVQAHPPILVGIQRDMCPPLAFGDTRLERMRIIVIAPEQAAQLFDSEPDVADGDLLAEVLPRWPQALPLARAPQSRPRPVLGEILRGENGALYERFGNRIRPLRRLVSGPSGEVLEIAGSREAPPRLHARVAAPPVIEEEVKPETESANSEDKVLSSQDQPKPGSGEGEKVNAFPAFHPLFPEPGQWRVVRLGDFKSMLAPQLVQPERLRDVHRLPCYVQVFELTAPQRMESLAEAIFGDASAVSGLRPLTPAIVQQLQLAPLLPAPPRLSRPMPRQPGLLLPHDRFFCLEIANDPTDEAGEKGNNGARENTTGGQRSSPSLPHSPAPPPATTASGHPLVPAPASIAGTATSAPAVPLTPPAPTALKASIPVQFLKPWEFRVSREEALFAMIRSRSFFGRVLAGLRRLTGGPLFSGEFRKWQVLLTGKNPDEQLWAVRPPKRALDHPLIREWAGRTLASAGYDPHLMLAEWEIFWRRKEV